MRIIVCAKHVVDSTEIRWDDERGEVVLRNLPTKISDYDRNALEAAVVPQGVRRATSTSTSSWSAVKPALKTLKEAVAMGADKGYLVEGGWDDPFDPLRTARVLARVIGGARRAGPHHVRPRLGGRLQRRHRAGARAAPRLALRGARAWGSRPGTADVQAVLDAAIGAAHGQGADAVRAWASTRR